MGNETTSGGIGLAGVLVIVFVVLKLTGTIAWSWWWVFSPLWLPWAFIMAFVSIGLLISFFVKVMIK